MPRHRQIDGEIIRRRVDIDGAGDGSADPDPVFPRPVSFECFAGLWKDSKCLKVLSPQAWKEWSYAWEQEYLCDTYLNNVKLKHRPALMKTQVLHVKLKLRMREETRDWVRNALADLH